MTTSTNNDLNSCSLNISYVEIERFLNQDVNAQTNTNDLGRKQLANSSKKVFESSVNKTNYLSNNSNSDIFQVSKQSKNQQQDNDRLKQILRNSNWSPVHPIRKNLWTNLLQLNNEIPPLNNKENKNPDVNKNNSYSNESEYIRYLNQVFGKSRDLNVSLPDFVLCNEAPSINKYATTTTTTTPSSSSSSSSLSASSNHLNYYYLNSKGKEAIKRILCVYEYLYPHVTYCPGLVSISSILLHYMQEHEVFSALCYLSSTKDHLIESKINWDTTCSVFTKLIKIYCKSSYEIISKYATESLDKIFNEWFWWIFDSLSFSYLVKIIDCYLLEGQKVLYRISLAIVQQFSKYVEFVHDFEHIFDYYYFIALKHQNTNVNSHSIKNFCSSPLAFESIERLLKMSFSIRNFKRSTIKELFLKEETKRKVLGVSVSTLKRVDDNNNSNNMKSLQSHENSFDLNTTPSRIFLKETNTDILTHKNLTTIWNWIPQRLTVNQPSLLFTTREHGTSVNTLFGILNDLEYSIIVIKTFQNEIFGAFCSGLWEERKNKSIYFGKGETFLFSLVPSKNLYRWVGAKNQKTLPHQELFLRVDKNKIVIGGGGNDGLSINSNLIEGTSYHCDTFENEPLASSTIFQIAILEVIGFTN